MHSVAYKCPVANLHMVSGIDCDQRLLDNLCSAPVNIECALCGTIHPVALRMPPRLRQERGNGLQWNAGA